MPTQISKTRRFWLGGLLISWTILSVGCASLSDYHYEHKQKKRAIAQYKQCGASQCSRYPSDYKKGWIDGFYEVATGGSCCPPAVAPACYWDPSQILDDCDNRRHEYYSGWQDGAARATQFPDTHFLKIYETCECPFPRCECPSGGPCNSSETNSCQSCSLDGGMVYDENVIETDQEILMVPIPDGDAVTPDDTVADSNDDVEADSQADGELMPPAPGRRTDQKKDAAESSQSGSSTSAKQDKKSKDKKPVEAKADPANEEPKSSSDGLIQTDSIRPVERRFDPISSSMKRSKVALLPRYKYNFGSDNSQTIEFDLPNQSAEPISMEITKLSDFDIQVDDLGLIE